MRSRSFSAVLAIMFVFISSCAIFAASSEKVMNRTYTAVTEKMYTSYYDIASFLIKSRGMYLVTSYRNRSNGYAYGCDAQGQMKAYLTMTYQEDVLSTELKLTYDGPLSEGEGTALSESIATEILDKMEAVDKLVTVKATTTVSLRDDASDKAGKLGAVRRGDILELITEQDKWWYVRTVAGPVIEGWVPKAYLRKR